MGEVDAALKPSNVAFQCVQALKERAKVIHQAPAFAPMERNSAGFERNPDASASRRPFGANVGLPFPFRGCREFFRLSEVGLVEQSERDDSPERLSRLAGNFLLR